MNTKRTRDVQSGMRRSRVIDSVIRDFRYGVRTLRRTPGLLAVLVFCLGLGVGVNGALFTLVDALVLEPPTARDPDRLVQIVTGNSDQISYPNYRDLREVAGFEAFAISTGATLTLRQGNSSVELTALQTSGNFFRLLDVDAALGRTFNPSESDPANRPQVVVLEHRFWAGTFAADPQMVGRTIDLNGEPFTVIGVLGPGFRVGMGLYRPDVYVPLSPLVSAGLDDRRANRFDLRARLVPGVTRQQAAAAFTAAAQQLEMAHPSDNAYLGRPANVQPLTGWGTIQSSGKKQQMAIVMAAPLVLFGLLLLIACANVAGVLLARGASRRHELTVRTALGASRAALIRMLLVECLLITGIGTVGGIVLAAFAVRAAGTIQLPNGVAFALPAVEPSTRLGLFAAAIAAGTCLLCGLLPALHATRLSLAAGLREALPGSRRRRWRSAIVIAQVAASVVLLATASMFLRSLVHVATLDPGFDVAHGVTARVTIERNRFSPGEQHRFAGRIVEQIESLPGVRSASFTSLVLLGGNSVQQRAELQNAPGRGFRVSMANVGPRFFETMGIALRSGREFRPSDRMGAAPVAIVNAAFVEAAGLDGGALGRSLRVSQDDEPWREIVGVVADAKYAFLGESPEPQVFLPYLQTGGELYLQARTAGAPAPLVPAVRNAIHAFDPTLVVNVQTTEEATSLEFMMRRALSGLLGALGALGVLLAMIGLFGMLAWDVSRRTAEIGIRMALGASRGAVHRAIATDGLRLVAWGTAAGLTAAVLLARPLRAVLVGVDPVDPVVIVPVASLLLLVAAVASWIPAHRASGIDPTLALKRE